METNNLKNPRTILLVEDDPHIAFNIQFHLETEGFEVEHAMDGQRAMDLFNEKGYCKYDIVVVDVMIPERNGIEVTEYVRRANPRVGILIVSALANDVDIIKGLEAGADDYLTKPFNLGELMLKIKRMAKRSELFQGATSKVTNSNSFNILECGPIRLDTGALVLTTENGDFQITDLEAKVLEAFIKNRGIVLTRDYLLRNVWNLNSSVETRTVDNFVLKLRKYLEKDPAKPIMLRSIRGRGYCFKPTEPELGVR